ncbi:MAG: tetratricopeptide repeat protein [Myxococcales bacterium]|nr:tetratricopeptide repeat protein [Myxococcales bacterium]
MRFGHGALLCCALAALTPGLALAQAGDGTAAPDASSARDPEHDALAKQHYELGTKHYTAYRYEQALTEFLEAYQLSDRPALLLNISLCYEKLGDFAHAKEYLGRYLDVADLTTEKRTELEEKRDRLAERLELVGQQGRVVNVGPEVNKTQPGETQTQPATATSETQPTESHDESSSRLWTWIVGGTAVAALGTGAVLLILAGSEYSDLEKKCGAVGCTDAQVDASSGPGMQTAGGVMLAVGGALAVTSVILYFLEGDSGEESPPSTQVGIGPTGISLSGRF